MPGGMFSKDKLIFDPAETAESDNIGSYLRAGTDGDLISSTLISGTERLDVNTLTEYLEDSAHASGDRGNFVLGVRNDSETSLVDADGDYAPLQFTSTGRLKVDANISIASDHVYAEDSAHSDGDLGSYVLSVRQDVLASSTSANGDYQSFKTDSLGRLWTRAMVSSDVADDDIDTENPIKVGSHVQAGPLAAISAAGDKANMISDLYRRVYVNNGSNIAIEDTQVNVDNTGVVALPTTALAGRRTIMVQNLSNKHIWLGKTAVSAANGFRLAAGATISLDIGPDITLYAFGSTASAQDIRVLELA